MDDLRNRANKQTDQPESPRAIKQKIQTHLEENGYLAADFLVTLFCTIIIEPSLIAKAEPFPTFLKKADSPDLNLDYTLKLVNEIPSIKKVSEDSTLMNRLSDDCLQLLDWLIFPVDFELRSTPIESNIQTSYFIDSNPFIIRVQKQREIPANKQNRD